MKRWLRWGLCLLLGIGPAVGAAAQAFDVEQLALDVEKLSELRQVLTDLKQGYQVLDAGYTAIRDLSKGSFDLRRAFLDGLLAVSPVVRQYQRVKDIVALETSMVSRYQTAWGQLRQNDRLSASELILIGQVYSGLIAESVDGLNDLVNVLTDGVFRASDAERVAEIDRLYAGMAERSDALDGVTDGATLLSQQRLREADQVSVLERLYGLKP
jgi:hypothetical protein